MRRRPLLPFFGGEGVGTQGEGRGGEILRLCTVGKRHSSSPGDSSLPHPLLIQP